MKGDGRVFRYTVDKDGEIHQFFPTADGVYHWAGATNGRTRDLVPRDIDGIDTIRKEIYEKFGYRR